MIRVCFLLDPCCGKTPVLRLRLIFTACCLVAVAGPVQAAPLRAKVREVRAGPDGPPLGYRIIGNPRARACTLPVPSSFFNHNQLTLWEVAHRRARQDRCVVQFDYPGVGLSSSLKPWSKDGSLLKAAAAIRQLVDYLRTHEGLAAKQLDLFGYSLGAAVALATAADHPELVRSVYCYGTPFPHPREELERVVQNYRETRSVFRRYWPEGYVDAPIDRRVLPKIYRPLNRIEPDPPKNGRPTRELLTGLPAQLMRRSAEPALLRRDLDVLKQRARRADQRALSRLKLIGLKLGAGWFLSGTNVSAIGGLLDRYANIERFSEDIEHLKAKLGTLADQPQIILGFAVGSRDVLTPLGMTTMIREIVGRGDIDRIAGGGHLNLAYNPIIARRAARAHLHFLQNVP
jgi:pimeloyl-ACP methyl ester carboxylesterase